MRLGTRLAKRAGNTIHKSIHHFHLVVNLKIENRIYFLSTIDTSFSSDSNPFRY